MWDKIKRGGWTFLKQAVKFIKPILTQSAAMAIERKVNEKLGNQ